MRLRSFPCLSLLIGTACSGKQELPPLGTGESPSSGVGSDASRNEIQGDFFSSGQAIPPLAAAFLLGKNAVGISKGVQKICIKNPGPPCVGRLKLDSGQVVELGSSYVCRFTQSADALSIKVLDVKDVVVFNGLIPMSSLSQIQGVSKELGTFDFKISVVTPCSL